MLTTTQSWQRPEAATEPHVFQNLFSDAKITRSSVETKSVIDPMLDGVAGSDVALEADEVVILPPTPDLVARMRVEANSAPIQIWEGTVIDVHSKAMTVSLSPKMGADEVHTAEIDLEWVSEQDKDLVRAGAVFYLTLYKKTSPSVENSEELRFRRRPAWSASQIDMMRKDAAAIRSMLSVTAKVAE